jgi:hypothetical protein
MQLRQAVVARLLYPSRVGGLSKRGAPTIFHSVRASHIPRLGTFKVGCLCDVIMVEGGDPALIVDAVFAPLASRRGPQPG